MEAIYNGMLKTMHNMMKASLQGYVFVLSQNSLFVTHPLNEHSLKAKSFSNINIEALRVNNKRIFLNAHYEGSMYLSTFKCPKES